MDKIQRTLQKFPVVAFFILSFFISWAGSFAVLGVKFLKSEPFGINDRLLTFLFMLAGPSIAGIVLTAILDGRSGVRSLFNRMRRWRVRPGWYLALAIFPVLIATVLIMLERLVSPVFHPGFTILGIVYGLLAGFFEETGWMGFAYPRMRLKFNALTASLILGVLHGTWHLLADFLGSYAFLGSFWLPHFAAMWIIGMTAMRVLLVWVYENTGSLLLAQLMHASSTGFLIFLSPAPVSPAEETLWYAVYGAILWLVTFRIISRVGKDLVPE